MENSDRTWTTQYDKQKRVDQDSRTKAATPYHRLVKTSRKPFTTEKAVPNSMKFKPK
jgi:hypothetical protein